MGQPAARVTDVAGHGGAIILGSFSVFICGMPAARLGDPLVCPAADGPKPHIMGNITSASATVKIDGAFAARMGDTTGCGIAGMSGKGMPPVKTSSGKGAALGDGDVGLGTYEYETQETDSHASAQGEVNIAKAEGETSLFDGAVKVKGSQKFGTAKGNAAGGMDQGMGGSAGAEASTATTSVEIGNSDGSQKLGGKATGPNAEANADLLLGSDGKRTGVAFGGKAGAAVAGAEGSYSYTIPVPFTDSTVNLKGSVGGTAGSIGGGAGAGLYHDSADDRYHGTFMLDIEVLLGVALNIDASVGSSTPPPGAGIPGVGVPSVPGTIASGAPTVNIG